MNQMTHLYREGMAELREENEQLSARVAELKDENKKLKACLAEANDDIHIILEQAKELARNNAKIKEELGIMTNQREYNRQQKSNKFYFENEMRGES